MSQNNLHDCVRTSLDTYFQDLDGTEPANLHDMLIKAV
jgi:Fis family transcriptional regulator